MSRFKGGTLIDEDVCDLEAHERRICDPDGYRPERCPRCGHEILHVHCYPERHPRGEPGMPPVVQIIQYVCARVACGATWRIVPRFLARHLWRVWPTVERVVSPDDAPRPRDAPSIPERTQRRWRSRIVASARVLIVLLAATGGVVFETIAARVGLDGTRGDLVEVHDDLVQVQAGARLATVAAIAHRLERGIRLL